MEKLKPEAIIKALQALLGPDSAIELSRDDPAGRITGWIMHPGFKGISHHGRQEWLWNGSSEEGDLPKWQGLRNAFGERSAQIGLVLTYSPLEYQNAFDESA